MATRVFELARKLGVGSKDVLTKCRAEGLDIKNHMTTLSAGLEATISEWFSESASGTAIETTEHVDLDKVRAKAEKRRRRKPKKPKTQPAEEVADVEKTEPAAEEAEAAEAETPVAEVGAAEAEQPAATEVEAEPAEAPPEKPKPAVVGPAGPQVVPAPAKMQGPRVVRVERPDKLAPPPRRRTPPPVSTGPSIVYGAPKRAKVPLQPEEPTRRKGKRRSPRRRGGRSADSGEKLREWRDQDLAERSERLAVASGGGLRRHRASVSRKVGDTGPSIKTGQVEIDEPITIKSLSAATGIKSVAIIKKLMEMNVPASVNQVIDRELAEMVVLDYDIELAVRQATTAETALFKKLKARPETQKTPRAPVVTMLGHVDHGKTSLLDTIRGTTVVAGEAGGITQHIGAYRYDKDNKQVVFLDTPGHEAFTAMRARGANMTDVVVLVVAADDGVMPQTVEAINHAKAAGVPVVVALNKIDVPNANIQRALGQLAEHDLQSREWGGDIELIQTSAETGEGIDNLVEILSLEAELLELTAETDAPASGYVIEAEMDPTRGALVRLLVLNGTLSLGDTVLAGMSYGRVRQMVDSHGRSVTEVGPSTPVEIVGLDDVPQAGDRFYVADDLDLVRAVAEQRREQARTKHLAPREKMTVESLLGQIEAGESNELPLIIKADVQGSVEALRGSLQKLNTDEARLNILHSAVGGISTGDVGLAEASNAIIIGFNVVPDAAARQLAEAKNVDIRRYRVIYDIIKDVRKAMEEGLAPEIREEILGRAEVRQVFQISRLGTVAGCLVSDGLAQRNAKVRIIRDNVVVEDNRTLDSLKRFKDDAREVRAGIECGIKIAGYNDVKKDDIIEFYQQVEVARTF
ncbi:MAG: translation initiation factor IF-2 [Planctomycetota bacterium]|nr:translation initiation factor IF-2 [Planctomycetota bacterium]